MSFKKIVYQAIAKFFVMPSVTDNTVIPKDDLLSIIELIMLIEEEMQVSIQLVDSDISKIVTAKDILDLVENGTANNKTDINSQTVLAPNNHPTCEKDVIEEKEEVCESTADNTKE